MLVGAERAASAFLTRRSAATRRLTNRPRKAKSCTEINSGIKHKLPVFSGTAPVHINNKQLGGKKDAESTKEKDDDNSGDRGRIVNE
jgi:hypothetical protein